MIEICPFRSERALRTYQKRALGLTFYESGIFVDSSNKINVYLRLVDLRHPIRITRRFCGVLLACSSASHAAATMTRKPDCVFDPS